MPRVFHADDEPTYRSLVRVVLSEADPSYEFVGQATDGAEAIELAPAVAPDLILLDIHMPGMNGLEALPRLRELCPDAKIVALTTVWRKAFADHFRSLGGDAFLEKPRDVMRLPAMIADVLHDRAADPLDVAETMFHTWWSGDHERTWDVFDPAASFTLLEGEEFVGVAAMRAHVEAVPEEERGSARAIKMTALGENVVIEAAAEVPRGEIRERFPIAWMLHVGDDGKIDRIRVYRSWSQARRAAGLHDGVEPTAERELSLGAGWIFAVIRRVLGRRPPVLRYA